MLLYNPDSIKCRTKKKKNVNHFVKHNCMKDFIKWAQEHFAQHSSFVNACILFLNYILHSILTFFFLNLGL